MSRGAARSDAKSRDEQRPDQRDGLLESTHGDATYVVNLPENTFEGPLDLLLHLVQKHELSIADLPVGFITEKYLEYLSLMRVMQIDIASEYLVMAATLVHLKSKTLLPPDPTQTGDDLDDDGGDPRAELIRRLLEYQKYKDAGEQLGARSVVGRDVFVRPQRGRESDPSTAKLADMGLYRLIEAFQSVLAQSKVEISHEVHADRISITERIHELCEILRLRPAILFEELFDGLSSRFDYVITFLALLEMTRLRMTRVYQSDAYMPLHIELTVRDDESMAAARQRLPQI